MEHSVPLQRRVHRVVAGRAGSVLQVDGIHDLGGMQGFGAVVHSPAEPAFHDRWEAVARALLAVVAGAVGASGGEFRHSIERMEPGHYLTSGYYEHWLTAAATLAVEHELVTRSELEARAGGRFPLSGPVLTPTVVDAGPDVGEPRFGVGDHVRVREWHPPGHTRCPRYVRGKAGTVVRWTAPIRCLISRPTAPPAATSRPIRSGSTPRAVAGRPARRIGARGPVGQLPGAIMSQDGHHPAAMCRLSSGSRRWRRC